MSYISMQNKAVRSTLISNFLIAELLASRARTDYTLWLIAPWIKNFTLHMPSRSDLTTLLGASEPSLFDVLRQIALNGSKVILVVRPEDNKWRVAQFIEPLHELRTVEPAIIVRQLHNLHTKIYVGQYGCLYGSPNLTASGAYHNVEFGHYTSDSRNIARLRNEAQIIFGQAEELSYD